MAGRISFVGSFHYAEEKVGDPVTMVLMKHPVVMSPILAIPRPSADAVPEHVTMIPMWPQAATTMSDSLATGMPSEEKEGLPVTIRPEVEIVIWLP